jgi:hypothetical protein
VHAAEHPQQRRLARAVHTDQADDVAGGDDEFEIGEQDAVPVARRQPLGDQCCAHRVRA